MIAISDASNTFWNFPDSFREVRVGHRTPRARYLIPPPGPSLFLASSGRDGSGRTESAGCRDQASGPAAARSEFDGRHAGAGRRGRMPGAVVPAPAGGGESLG